jgi:hypothetical protein
VDARRTKHVKKQLYNNWTWTSNKEKTSPHLVATPSMWNFDDYRIFNFVATKKHLEPFCTLGGKQGILLLFEGERSNSIFTKDIHLILIPK